MLKIVYPICCGIDVHKTFVVATIATTDRENITTYQTKRFSTFTQDLRALAQWISNNHCVYVCMYLLQCKNKLHQWNKLLHPAKF